MAASGITHAAPDEALRHWLADYIRQHPHHPTAVLARSQFIGISRKALDAYLAGTYFQAVEEGGVGADPESSGIEAAIQGYRERIEGIQRHGYLGTFLETRTWKYLRHACETALNENAIVVAYGQPGVGKTRCLLEYVLQEMTSIPVQVLCSRNISPTSFLTVLGEELGVEGGRNLHLSEVALAKKLARSPRPIFVDQANYLSERALGSLCFLWEKRRVPMVLVGTKELFDLFYRSKLTEDVRGQLTSRVALHYLLPELTPAETQAIVEQALGAAATPEIVGQIHKLTGGIFRSVDMLVPRLLEFQRRNQAQLASGETSLPEIIKVAASRLMI